MSARRLDLVFLWHMHQPDYRDRGSGEFAMPWVYLHAIKDYTDMAAHLEAHPEIHAVVNFVPVLIEQIEDYVDQFASGIYRDPLLRLLASPDPDSLQVEDRQWVLDTCFRCNHATMLTPFSAYQHLHDLFQQCARTGDPSSLQYLSGAYFADLLTWYHLAWTGESERRKSPLLAELMARGTGFGLADRLNLLKLIGSILSGLIPRYRNLQDRGQIELSATPYAHPLAPLLLDFTVARESQPDVPLPATSCYPGGETRVLRHLDAASSSHAQHFGLPPQGMWPAEGGLSAAFLRLLADKGCRWVATGEGVLRNSLDEPAAGAAFRPWRLAGDRQPALFFRDDRLSDLIGFEYAKWHGRDAARHFAAQLESIAAAVPEGEVPVVSVILDGENAWEYYPYNGHFFFEDLYGMLEAHSCIRTRTYAHILADAVHAGHGTLPRLTAGSWVHGTLATWIGDAAKNRAWDLLCDAKKSYDQVMASGRLTTDQAAAAEARLAICESSDWFWWFGDYNPAASVIAFDRLFRRNLSALYRSLQLSPPAHLEIPLSAGCQDDLTVAAGGTMRRATDHPHQSP